MTSTQEQPQENSTEAKKRYAKYDRYVMLSFFPRHTLLSANISVARSTFEYSVEGSEEEEEEEEEKSWFCIYQDK